MKEMLKNWFEEHKDEAAQVLMDFVKTAPVNPRSGEGGKGETEAAKVLAGYLEKWGFTVHRKDAMDPEFGPRPNIWAVLEGEDTSRTIWLIGHMDVVSPGDLSLWETDPFEPVLTEEGWVIGRGAEDNGQGVVSSMFALRAMKELGIKPKYNVAALLVADEETGSEYGLQFLIKEGLFKKEDMAIVPDGGTPDGHFIEVAEKSILWLRFTIHGKQSHASRPHLAVNARLAGSHLAVYLHEYLHDVYADRDNIFEPPYSTFEMTKIEPNVDSVNIIPGKDVFYMDMRILPQWKLDDVLDAVYSIVTKVEYEFKVKVDVDVIQRNDAAPPTSPDAEIARRLAYAIKEDRDIQPVIGGVGGGTVAAHLRYIGVDSVVWATIEEYAHQPNEKASIDNLLADARTFILAVTADEF